MTFRTRSASLALLCGLALTGFVDSQGCGGASSTPAEVEMTSVAPWLFSFGTSVPYALTMSMTSAPDGAGGYTGFYVWAFWYDKADAQSGLDPECYFYDAIKAAPHLPVNPNVDYNSCEGCSEFWETTQTYDHAEGDCSKELWEFWYTDGAGNPTLTYDQLMGWRDAATAGWPAEFADLATSLEQAGYTGTIYDQVAADDGAFFPIFASTPTNARSAGTGAPLIDVPDPATARQLARSLGSAARR